MACVIAAPASGSGKTLLCVLLSSWAKKKGISLQAFKVGPDYLDPKQLTAITGRSCRNLDLVLCGSKWVNQSFNTFGANAELTLIEGVMGLFDGVGSSQKGSTAEVAKELELPVVLIINSQGQAASLAALVKGFKGQDTDIKIAGVVLNNINSIRHKELLEEVLSGIKVKTLGWLPKDPRCHLHSKHLGLEPPQIEHLEERINAWAAIAESNLDLKSFQSLLKAPSQSKSHIEQLFNSYPRANSLKKDFPIAIAQDKAFYFHYPEMKEVFELNNMPLIPWKITEDEPIPRESKGIILPGGFPEQYAEQISKSHRSMHSLREAYGVLPIYAECGGMMVLGEGIEDLNGNLFSMSGILPFNSKKADLSVGYRSLYGLKDSLIVRTGDKLIGHEFHRWQISIKKAPGSLIDNSLTFQYPWEIESWRSIKKKEGWSNKLIHASWIHLHWASSKNLLFRWEEAVKGK